MISLLSARQIVEYLPLLKYITQNSLNHLGYNITLPEFLDNKTLLIAVHLMLGNTAAQYLPADSIATGMFISSIDTGGYAMRLMAIEYLKTQQPADNSVELAKICRITILAYTLPSMATCAMTKLALPDSTCALTGYDVMASGSLGAVQCYSNYKATVEYAEPTTSDMVVPYLVDAMMLFSLSRNLHLDRSNPAMLMLSIKNTMSVAATVFATDCMTRMVMDFVPQEVKEAYIDPIFDYAYNITNAGIDNIKQMSGDVVDYFRQEGEL